jgi:lysophospholipase L1-like esterase
MDIIKNIKVFGDSILKGIQINPTNNRYHVDNHIDLDAIQQKHSVSIENYSKFGCTISKGYEMLKKHLKDGRFCDAVVMNFGGNDCDYDWKAISENPYIEHQPKTPLNEFAKKYHEIISILREKAITPILATLPPLAPKKFFDWFCDGLNKDNVLTWLGDINAIYRVQEKYSRMVERIAQEVNVYLVDLRGVFLRDIHLEHLLCEDGTHPNTKGQNAITAAFMDFAESIASIRDCTKTKEMRVIL